MLDIYIFNTQIYIYSLKAPKNSVLHFGIQKSKALKINECKWFVNTPPAYSGIQVFSKMKPHGNVVRKTL